MYKSVGARAFKRWRDLAILQKIHSFGWYRLVYPAHTPPGESKCQTWYGDVLTSMVVRYDS